MKRMLAAIAAAALLVSGAVLGFATSASAHTGDLNATAYCNPQTGEYEVTYTLTIANTGLSGTSWWRVGTTSFDGTPSSNAGMTDNPTVATAGSGNYPLTTITLPGNSTQAPWAYAWSEWTDGYKYGSDGGDIALLGDCTKPDEPIADAALSFTPPTCTTGGTVAEGTLTHATWTTPLSVDGANYSATATADEGYTFPDGSKTKPFSGTLPGPDTSLCPTNVECPAITDGGKATDLNLNGWDPTYDTRSAGHWEFVDGGLHTWTDDASSQAKVSWAKSASFALSSTGEIGVSYIVNTGIQPGVNLFIDFDNNGSVDGTLVYEAVYGQDLWLTNGSAQFVKDNAPVVGGGNGSQWHGTIDQWLAKFPDAWVYGIAFALGSGVHADGTLLSITVGCAQYTFGRSPQPPTEYQQEVTEGEPNCAEDEVVITTKFYERTATWNGTGWVYGEWVLTDTQYTDRPLTEEEIAQNCVIEDIPEASYTDECGTDNGELTLSDPSSDAWAWDVSESNGVITTRAVPVGVYEFGEEVQTVFTFDVNDEACPPVLALTGGSIGLEWVIGAGLVILLGAGLAVTATRRRV